MKHMPMFVVITLLISACTRNASTPAPTVLPLNFPIPSPTQCQPGDLLLSSNSAMTAEAIILGATLTNQTNHPCALSNPANVTLLTDSGDPYELQTAASPAIQTPPASASWLLAPSGSTIITVVWRNYCQSEPATSLILSIFLTDKQTLAIPMNVPSMPRCQAGSETATITINPYSNPP